MLRNIGLSSKRWQYTNSTVGSGARINRARSCQLCNTITMACQPLNLLSAIIAPLACQPLTIGNHAHNNNDFYPSACCGFYKNERSQQEERRAAEKSQGLQGCQWLRRWREVGWTAKATPSRPQSHWSHAKDFVASLNAGWELFFRKQVWISIRWKGNGNPMWSEIWRLNTFTT